LTTRVDKTGADDYRGSIDGLRAKHAHAQATLDELKAAGNEKWERFSADIWITWNELENAFMDFQQLVQKKMKEKDEGKTKAR
jgi:hypothetical protein